MLVVNCERVIKKCETYCCTVLGRDCFARISRTKNAGKQMHSLYNIGIISEKGLIYSYSFQRNLRKKCNNVKCSIILIGFILHLIEIKLKTSWHLGTEYSIHTL